MSVSDLRPYQSAVEQAHRLGVPRDQAIHAVAEEKRQGKSGNNVAGLFQRRRLNAPFEPTPPEAA